MAPARRRSTAFAARTALGFALALATVTPAWAGEPSPAEIAALRQLFTEGKDLEKQKAWADALERFKKVGEVKMTPQVRFHIALCDERLGRLVAALNGFELALDEAKRAGSPAAEVTENAPPHIDDIKKRVPTLRLVSDQPLGAAKVLLDGSAVAPALLGTDLPLDPGKHVVEVDNGGKIVFRRELTLTERTPQKLNLQLEPDEETPAVAPVPTPPNSKPSEDPKTDADPPPSTNPPDKTGPGRWPAALALGLGVASFGGAAVFFVLRQGTIDDVRTSCVGKQADTKCDPDLQSTADRGKTFTAVGDVLLGVGGAAVITAGVLFFVLAPSKKPASKTSFGIAPAPTGLRFVGAF